MVGRGGVPGRDHAAHRRQSGTAVRANPRGLRNAAVDPARDARGGGGTRDALAWSIGRCRNRTRDGGPRRGPCARIRWIAAALAWTRERTACGTPSVDHRRGLRHQPAHPPGGCERQRPAAQPVVLPALQSGRPAILLSRPRRSQPWRTPRSCCCSYLSRWHTCAGGVRSTTVSRPIPRWSKANDEETAACVTGLADRPCAGGAGSPRGRRHGSGPAAAGKARHRRRTALPARPAGSRRLGAEVGRHHGAVAARISREPGKVQRKRRPVHHAAGRLPAGQRQERRVDQRVAAGHRATTPRWR